MLELIFIKYLLDYTIYNKYRFVVKLKDTDKELKNLYKVLDALVENYQRTISFDEYRLSVLSDFPDYEIFLNQIEEANVQQDMLLDRVKTLQERSLAYDAAVVAIDVSEGRKDVSELFNVIDKFEHTSEELDVEFVTDDLEELYNETVHTPGLRWRLPCLNQSLGSLRKGDFGFLFARPETGKTTFLASEVTYFARQVERPILWFNNEEQGNKVKVRLYQASLGCTLAQLYSDRPRSHAEFMKRTNGNIKLIDNATIHKRQVEALCREFKPSLIIFDQIDKIKGFDNDREDLRLGAIYIWARELAKTYCPTIGVCQADVSGEGKKWLTMDNVANAKTSKQAEADWILGIGTTHDVGMEFMRYLHLSKNKLAGDEDSKPEMRHGRMEVVIKPDIARYGMVGM